MALNKKIKDELHALKGLDSSSVYDEEDQKKKKAAQAKANASKARQELIRTTGSGTAGSTKTTSGAAAKKSASRAQNKQDDELSRLRNALRDRLSNMRTDPKSYADRYEDDESARKRKELLVGSMLNSENLLNVDTDGVYDARQLVQGMKGMAAQTANNAGRAENWKAEAEGFGNTALGNFYGSAKETLDRLAGQLDQAIKDVYSPVNRMKEAAKEEEFAGLLKYFNDRYWGTGARTATDDEIGTGSDENRRQIALLEEKKAGGTITKDEQFLLDTLMKVQQKYDSGNVTVYDNDLEEAAEGRLAAQDAYLQTRANVDYFGDWLKSAQERLAETNWMGEQQQKMLETERALTEDASYNFTQADYEAFKDEMLAAQNRAAAAGISTYSSDVRDQYTYNEARRYDYLRKTQGQTAADEYAEYIQPAVAERINQQHIEQMGLAPDENGIVTDAPNWFESAVGSVIFNPTKILNTIDVMLQTADRAVTGSAQPVDYQTTGLGREMSNEYRENAVNTLNQYGTFGEWISNITDGKVKIGKNTAVGRVIGGIGLGDLLGVGIDAANNWVNTGLFTPAGVGAAVFGEVFADEYADARDAGGTSDQSFWKSIFSGLAEGAGEQIVFDRYLDKLKNIGRRPTIKGKLWTGIARTLSTAGYLAEGGVQEAATTWMQQAADKWFMGENSQFETRIYDLTAQGYDPDTAIDIAQNEMDDEMLMSFVMGSIGQAQGMAIPSAVGGAMNIADTVAGDRYIGAQIREQGNAPGMMQKISEISGKAAKTVGSDRQIGAQYRKFMDKAGKYVKKADMELKSITMGKINEVRNAPVKPLEGTSQATKEKASKRLASMQQDENGASVGGESVTVQGFVKTAGKDGDARLNIKKADGTLAEADIADVTFDSATAEVYSYAADMATPELANTFRMSIEPAQAASIEQVANGYSQAYDMAKAGFKEASIRGSNLTSALTDAQVSTVYKLGAEARRNTQLETIATAKQRAEANLGNKWKGGKATFDESVVVDALDNEQKSQIDMASAVTGAMGVNVVFFESKADETGRYTRENGSYNRRTNTIYIDVNAGRYYKGDSPSQTALMRTLSHEVTHAIQRNSPESYAELRDMVVDILGDAKGATIEDLIDRKMATDSSLTTRDAAIDELVADACEKMLEDSDAAQRLAEAHSEAAKTFFQKVGELLNRIAEAIRAAFKGRKLSTEAQLVMKDVERYQKVVDLWTKGAMQTAEVSGKEQGEMADSETENAAISEETAAGGENITSGEVVGEYGEPARPAETHIDNRTWESVGDRGVKAFQNEYKYARVYMGPAAKALLEDAKVSLPGARYQTMDGEWGGQTRQTTDVLAELKDRGGWSWDQLKSALGTITDMFDAGDLETELPDTAIVKRIEIILDEILTEGYDAMEGARIVPNAGYVAYKNALPGAAGQGSVQHEEGLTFEEYTQFQMRRPVERAKGLVAVHNLTEEKLVEAMKLGGFPMPSVAIAKTSIGHQNFGPISLVFGSDTIDPKVNRKNKVYSADAWTPTFPRIEYQVNDAAERRVNSKLADLRRRIDPFFERDLQRLLYGTEDLLNRYDGEEGLIKHVLDNYGMKAAYLEDTGRHADAVTRTEERIREVNPLRGEIYTAIAELVGLEGLRSRSLGEIRDMYGAQLEEIYPGSTKSAMRLSRILSNVIEYFENKDSAPETVTVTDAAATNRAVDDAVDMAAYEQWVRELYDGIEAASGVYNGKDIYNSSGNRRSFASTHYPVSVENIAKAMYDAYGGKMKNVSAHYDAKTMRAVTARTFRSIDEMHKYEGRMRARTQEEADALTNDLNSRLNTLVSRIQTEKNAGRKLDLYEEMTQADQIGAILQEIAVKKFDPASLQNGLAAYGYQIGEQTAAELSKLITEISEMPVNIFEAKPERAVYFDEVRYAIVPDDMNADVRRQLEQLVPDVREYTEGDEARRLELLNEREDVQFQARTLADGTTYVAIDAADIGTSETTADDSLAKRTRFYMRERFRGTVLPLGKTKSAYIRSEAINEYTNPAATITTEAYNSKMIAATELHNLLKASTFVRWNPDDGRHKDAVRGWNTWLTRFAVYDNASRDIQVFEGEVKIKRIARGDVFYDITKIKNITDGIMGQSIKADAQSISDKFSIAQANADVNPDIQKQTRDEAISTRYALANMLETDTVSGEEVAWLRGYKNQFAKLEQLLGAIDQNKKIIRELMFKKGRTEEESVELQKARERNKILQDKVASIDEGLLKLEKADVIRSLVAREEQKIRDREAEKRREGIAKVRESQRNTAIRKNIQRRAKKLDRMLRQPSDKEHIPEGLRGAMLDMMEIFTGSEAAFGGAKSDRERLYRAQREYEAMRGDEDNADLASRYDEDTADRLGRLAKLMNDRKIADFNNAELTQLSMVIEHFEHLVRDQNDEFAQSRRKITEGYAEQIWQQTMTMKGRKENAITGNALVKALKHLGHANVIPPYFYKHLGGAMGKLGNDLLKAEGRYGVNMNKAAKRLDEIRRKYEHDKWATKRGDILKLETEIGDTLELTREQALGIWASAKRERLNTVQRAAHLRDGGVILEKSARKLGMKGQEINVTPTKISQRDIQQIDNWLTDQQKKYADEMVSYISHDMAALGNETSMELAGYRKFGEGYYYPYKTSSDFRRTELGKVENALIKNMGFTKSVVRNAKTPVVITDFSATVADHVNAMIMYNAFAVAQDQMMRVYDFKLDDSNSVKNLLRNAFGDEIPAYIEQHMRDLYGGVSPDRDAGPINWFIGAHKKQAVLGSMSVVVQQPTALIRAMSQINPKYFVGQKAKGGFKEAMDYAGTAVIKDIGGFDSGVGRGATDWLNGKPKDWQNHRIKTGLDTVSDWAGLGAEYADKLAWMAIWKAVKREQADKYKIDINSPELKELAGERFDEVVRLTQVYDSVMTRSQLMRNKNLFWKMATSFMSEPTVTWNMMYDAGIEAFKNKKVGKAGGIIASVLVSTILTNLAKAVVTAARDDDDEEATYLERYVKNAAEGLVNDVVPFNYMPIVRDIYSKLQGYDVERADMGIINDMLAAGEVMLDEEKAPIAKVKSLVQMVSIMTGLPGKNIWRDVEAAFNTFGATPQNEARPGWLENALRTGVIDATPIGKWFNLTDSKANNADRMFEAILDGDTAGAEELREHLKVYNGADDDKAVDSLLRDRIKEGYENGEITDDEAIDMLTVHAGLKKYDAEKRVSQWSYGVETGTKYSDLKDAYLEGEITKAEAIRARAEYGGLDEDDAQATVAKWEYELDTGIAYDDMKDAYIAGDVTRTEAINARVKYGGVDKADAEKTLQQWEYEKKSGIPYADIKDAFIAGELTEKQAVNARMQYGGAREAEALQTVAEWQYEKDTGRSWSDMKADYIAGWISAKDVANAQVKYAGAFEKDVKAQILKWDFEKETGIAYNDMKGAYIEGDITAKEAVAARIKYGGMEAEDAELDVSKWDFEIDYGYDYDDMSDYYELGKISKSEAIAARVKYGKSEKDDAYFAVTGWQYEMDTGKEWEGKFTKVHDAVDSRNVRALQTAIKEVYDNSAYADGKKAASALTSNITSTYKPMYIKASATERAAMEEMLLDAYKYAYELAGERYYGDSYKLKQIRKWLED